jgi:hypothetical protein
VVQKYVLSTIADERLQVYAVWGPMLGEEKAEDAPQATTHLPDRRVVHYWTAANTLALALAKPLAMEGTRAWDTFQLYPAGVKWGETPPTPGYYMHVNRPLPPERRLHGEKLAAEVRKMLAAIPAAGGASPGISLLAAPRCPPASSSQARGE